jgi:hypothetical protein
MPIVPMHRTAVDLSDIQFFPSLVCTFHAQKLVAGLYGSRRSAIESPGGVNDSFLP